MDWAHTYRVGQIPPNAVIHEHTPGRKLAEAVSELQENVVTDIALDLGEGLTGGVAIADNTATIQISVDETNPLGSGSGGDGLPAGGEQYQVLQRDVNGNAVWDWVRAHE